MQEDYFVGTTLTSTKNIYFGGIYETHSDSTVIKYYSFNGQTVAMDDGNGLKYFLTDHLGSTVAILDDEGTLIEQQRYLPFGGERTDISSPIVSTDFNYTGQRDLDGTRLMDYDFRFYSPVLGRFISPDNIVPDAANPQAWNKYSYVNNRPINFNDPSGHYPICQPGVHCPLKSNTVIFFGGSYPTNINKPGPAPHEQTLIWTTDQSGIRRVNVVPYPGNQYAVKDDERPYVAVPGKTQQALNAQGLLPNADVDLIAYSAGTESALMYALWRLENGQDVNSIVLLGPTFVTSDMNFDEPDGGWSAVMDTLIEQGVNIYVLDDGYTANDAADYSPPTGSGYGNYQYLDKWGTFHYSRYPTRWPGTNNSQRIKKEIYSLLTPY